MRRVLLILLLGLSALTPIGVRAQPDYTGTLDSTGEAVYGTADATPLTTLIGQILAAATAFLGIVLLIIIIYAGFLWMTAGGNSDQVQKARTWLINAVIGLIIVMAAYAITTEVILSLQLAVAPVP